mmetsp:Transcript_12616/g.31058  ORF Transcript_12616/g.31058 Transcript_12616/m.31058 type:complete len:200 (-) Transcript_12616:154-753(-)
MGRDLASHLLGQYLSELNTPLIERINLPNKPFDRSAMLKYGQELAQAVSVQLWQEHGGRRPIAREDFVWYQLFCNPLSTNFLCGLAVCQSIRLSKEVAHQLFVIRNGFPIECNWLLALHTADEIGGHHTALMHQLVERVLPIGSRFTKVNWAGRKRKFRSIESYAFPITLHVHLLNVRCQFEQSLLVGQQGSSFVTEKS